MPEIDYHYGGSIPLAGEADVVIIGGGPAELSAAVMSARMGMRVIVVEKWSVAGGMASVGEVMPFMLNHLGEESMDYPVFDEWRQRMWGYHSEATERRVLDFLGQKMRCFLLKKR